MDGYKLVNGYCEQGREEDNAKRKKGFQDYVALFDNTPDSQYGDRRPSDDADDTYDKADEIDRS